MKELGRPLTLVRRRREDQPHRGDVTGTVPSSLCSQIWVELDSRAIREMVGERPGPDHLTSLKAEVMEAVHQVMGEIRTGTFGTTALLVRGRPLADWLSMDDLVRLLQSKERQ